MPSGGEVGPGRAQLQSRRVRDHAERQRRSVLLGAADGGDHAPRTRSRSRKPIFRTLALPRGFTAKGGRFFSGFGYLNEVHAHAWDFVDQPLAYQAFFGNQYTQDGLQVKWLAPTDLFIELGAETGNGDAFPSTRLSRNGVNGATLFAHVGGDIGDSTSWRAGAAWLDQRAEDRTYEDVDDLGQPVTNAFTGDSRTWVVDAVLKWAPDGNATRQQLKIQGEYMHRRESGQLAFDRIGRWR